MAEGIFDRHGLHVTPLLRKKMPTLDQCGFECINCHKIFCNLACVLEGGGVQMLMWCEGCEKSNPTANKPKRRRRPRERCAI